MILGDKEKWSTVVKNDNSYDGLFYYGLKTTGIFCRPSCKSKEPKQSNVSYFDNVEEAYAFGLRPCKRCRPDLLVFKPMDESIDQAKYIIEVYFTDGDTLHTKLKELGISQNYFINLFKNKFGVTPVEYLKSLRIRKAKELLISNEMNILEIAVDCGFGSLSAFYYAFKRSLNMTPNEYKKMNRSDG